MKIRFQIFVFFVFFVPSCSIAFSADIAVHFSPGKECTAAAVAEIARATDQIHVQAYNFSSPEIVEALIAAHRRGVHVQLCLDARATHQKKSGLKPCREAGIPTWIDGSHPIAHSKVLLIDNRVLVTGSFNFSAHAEKNLENLLVIRDAELVKKYEANWQAHRKHATQ